MHGAGSRSLEELHLDSLSILVEVVFLLKLHPLVLQPLRRICQKVVPTEDGCSRRGRTKKGGMERAMVNMKCVGMIDSLHCVIILVTPSI